MGNGGPTGISGGAPKGRVSQRGERETRKELLVPVSDGFIIQGVCGTVCDQCRTWNTPGAHT